MAIGLVGTFPDKNVRFPNGELNRSNELGRLGEQPGGDLPVALPKQNKGVSDKGRKADAPLTQLRKAVIGCVHLFVMAAIIGLFVWCTMKAVGAVPWGAKSKAELTLVARDLTGVPAPADGMLNVPNPFPPGSSLTKGQVLAWLTVPGLKEKIEETQRALVSLQRQKLLLDPQGSGLDQGQEFRQIAGQIRAANDKLRRLRQIEQDACIRAPLSGQLPYGLSGSKAVQAGDTIVDIWPENGDLVVEVKAPQKVIHELIQSDCVEAVFSTAGGKVYVTARPIPDSVRPLTEEAGPQKQKEIWGVLQCTIVSIPVSVRTPGLIGRLQ